MINGKRVLAIIPARIGSVGIKEKNICLIHGKPLIGYTIEAAAGSRYLDRTIISTESEKIAEISRKLGGDVPFLRPEVLATDTARSIDVMLHAIEALRQEGDCYDVIVLLQATSPLRDENDIDNALEYFESVGEKSVLAVSKSERNPVLMREKTPEGRLIPLIKAGSTVRRQDFKEYYIVNGAIYINLCEELTGDTSLNDNLYGWEIPPSHALDIDTPEDIDAVKKVLSLQKQKKDAASKKITNSTKVFL